MNILIDCCQLTKGKGKSIGIYNYTKYLLDNLIPNLVDKYNIFILNNKNNLDDFKYLGSKNIVLEYNFDKNLNKVLWEIYWVRKYIKKYNIDLYYSSRGFLPPFVKECRLVTTVHDLIPIYYKENYKEDLNFMENKYIVNRLRNSCKRADGLITISEFSKKQVVDYFGINGDKISVIYNGLDLNTSYKEINKKEDFIFSITSSSLKHKNLEGILKAYNSYFKLSENPMRLKLCGVKDDTLIKKIIDEEALNSVDILPFLSDDELNGYYKYANVFLFLSKIEGFGFPPLESLKFSTPVICSDIECFREILDSGVTFVNENVADDVAEALLKYEKKQNFHIDISNLEMKYNWENVANRFEKIFDKVLHMKK